MQDGAAMPGKNETDNTDKGYPPCEGISRREITAVIWIASFVLAILLVGFQIGIPLAALLYCLFGIRFSTRLWKTVYTICTVGTLYLLASEFMSAFHLTYAGLIH